MAKARRLLQFKTSEAIELVAPVNVLTDNALDNTIDGSTCTFRIFDPAKDEAITVLEASGQTILSVSEAGVFVIGDQIELTQDDATIHVSTVNAVDASAGTITLDDATTDTAAVGNQIRVRLGLVVTMTEYGTPKVGERNWGFRGTLESNHAGLTDGLDVDIEVSFVGAVAGGVDYLETICATVQRKTDCD